MLLGALYSESRFWLSFEIIVSVIKIMFAKIKNKLYEKEMNVRAYSFLSVNKKIKNYDDEKKNSIGNSPCAITCETNVFLSSPLLMYSHVTITFRKSLLCI